MPMTVTDAFAERHFPVDRREFVERSGTWLCNLDGPVDLSPVDLRVFHLRFILKEPAPRWKGTAATERRLELRTSEISFHFEAGYAGWLLLVIDGFLDADETAGVREAFNIERG
jgi:hypothetical protein